MKTTTHTINHVTSVIHYSAVDATGHKNLIVRQCGNVSRESAARLAERHAKRRGATVQSIDFIGRKQAGK